MPMLAHLIAGTVLVELAQRLLCRAIARLMPSDADGAPSHARILA